MKNDQKDLYVNEKLKPWRGHNSRRDFHNIMIQILETAKQGIRKTNIMYEVKLTYPQLGRYLDALESTSLIREEQNIWRTTKKGVRLLQTYRECYPFIEETRRAYFSNEKVDKNQTLEIPQSSK